MITMLRASRVTKFAFLALTLATTASADVWVVDAAGGGDFADLPPAIAAATDGDVIVVRSGTYQGFSLTGKGLSILGDAPDVRVIGLVRVESVPASSSLVLADLLIEGATSTSLDLSLIQGLILEDVLGPLRVQRCVITGGSKSSNTKHGGNAVSVTRCPQAAFVETQFLGRNGLDASSDVHNGGDGGHGLWSVDSRVLLEGCTLVGGRGAGGDGGGDGGAGAWVSGPQQFMVTIGSSFDGGDGGSDVQCFFSAPGDGGAGLRVGRGGKARTRDSTFVGSLPGRGCGQADPGPVVSVDPASQLWHYSGSSRVVSFPSTLHTSGNPSTVPVVVTGEPGDRVWLLNGTTSTWSFVVPLSGVWTLPAPFLRPLLPKVVLPPSGSATIQLSLPPLAPGQTESQRFYQGFVVSAAGKALSATPWTIVTVQ